MVHLFFVTISIDRHHGFLLALSGSALVMLDFCLGLQVRRRAAAILDHIDPDWYSNIWSPQTDLRGQQQQQEEGGCVVGLHQPTIHGGGHLAQLIRR